MARPLRLEFPGALYHVISRGNARQRIFLDDPDRARLLSLLAREIRQQGWLCHAYCLMDNHFHLLLETPTMGLARGMQRLNGSYSQAFNHRHDRAGHLLQGRYKSILVERDSYLLELSRYIVLNPVRAGCVAVPDAWEWSSYRATAGMVPSPDWLQVDWLLAQFGGTRGLARHAYRRFVHAGRNATSPMKEVRGQMWLGSASFRRRMQERVGDEPLPEIPIDQRRPARPSKEELLEIICAVFDTPLAAVLSRENQEAYRAAAYVLRRKANLKLKEVAALFGVSCSRVAHIQRRIESYPPSRNLARLLNRCKVKI